MELRECANPECDEFFEPRVHNAIYCGDECRRIETNRKVLEKYYENKDRIESNKKNERRCRNEDCTTILSRYNEESICEPCKTERLINRLSSWGWDEDRLRDEWSE